MRRRPALKLPRFTPHSESGRPLYLQVRDVIRQAIVREGVGAGGRLPSTRSLAESFGVSRNTVLTAYERLAAEGLISGRIGSGTRVKAGGKRPQWRDLEFLVRNSHYPADPLRLADPDGNPIYLHR